MADITAGPIPREALAYLQAKKLRVGFDYRDVWREEHAGAFTVAKMAELDMLSDMRDSLHEALAKGTPYRQWAKHVTPELQKRGWWGMKEATDPLTGETRLVQLGSPRRLKTIYEANLRTARQAGQWARIQRTKVTHPYLLYQLGPSIHHRPQHVAWSGTLLPVEDEFWSYAMPPNGWGCKCWVRQVSKTEHRRLMDKGYQDPLAPMAIDEHTGLPTGHRQTRMLPVKAERPQITYRKWVNKRTGEVERIPDGIDPGWDTNPGHVAQRHALARQFMQSVNRAPARVGAEAMHQVLPVIQDDLDGAYKEWVDTIDNGHLAGHGGRRTIGALTPDLVDALRRRANVTPTTAGLTIEQAEVDRMLSQAGKGDSPLTVGQVRHLVRSLASPRAVVWDASGKRPQLVYVFDPVVSGAGRAPHIALRIDLAHETGGINAITGMAPATAAELTGPDRVRLDDGGAL